MTAVNVHGALQLARRSSSSTKSFTLEAQVLLADILERSRAGVLSHPELELDKEQQERFLAGLAELQAGVPLAYILGWQEFYGRRFEVTQDTLIPRPETEQLIEISLGVIRDLSGPRVADAGTGSGCIAITLACECTKASVIATDRSKAALAVASRNRRRHGVNGRLSLLQADLLTPLLGVFDLICANLPYIPSRRLSDPDVGTHEPNLALDGGLDGMQFTTRLIHQLPYLLSESGVAVLEIDEGQADSLRAVAAEHLPGSAVRVEHDLAGFERMLVIERNAG